MKQLIVVRHGLPYDGMDELCPQGKVQITQLADNLSLFLNKRSSILMLTSPAQRARESADILARKFGVAAEPMEEDFKLFAVMDVRQHDADVLVFIVHEPQSSFPIAAAQKYWAGRRPTDGDDLECGEAWVLDMDGLTLTKVLPAIRRVFFEPRSVVKSYKDQLKDMAEWYQALANIAARISKHMG